MSSYYAIVPAVGGLALLLGSAATLMTDRFDTCADVDEPRPIYVRYLSDATYDLRKRPHWIFVATQLIFGPCMLATAQWQAELARTTTSSTTDTGDEALADALTYMSIGCVAGAFGTAAFPNGNNRVGFAAHMVSASVFAACGCIYMFQAKKVADHLQLPGLATFRFVCAMLAMVGGGVNVVATVSGVTQATEQLKRHKEYSILLKQKAANDMDDLDGNGISMTHRNSADGGLDDEETNGNAQLNDVDNNNDDNNNNINDDNNNEQLCIMTPLQVQKARRAETVLALGQIFLVLGGGMALLSGVADVPDVVDSPSTVVTFPLVAFGAIMVPCVALLVYTNAWFYQTCQAPKETGQQHPKVAEEPGAMEETMTP